MLSIRLTTQFVASPRQHIFPAEPIMTELQRTCLAQKIWGQTPDLPFRNKKTPSTVPRAWLEKLVQRYQVCPAQTDGSLADH